MNKNLLSFETYSTIKHDLPYFYFIELRDQILYYFGSNHTKDINNPQFELLKNKWLEFLQKTSGKKSILFYEGNIKIDDEIPLEKFIEKYGESGAMVFWAKQAHVKVNRPEPTEGESTKELLKDFSKEEVFYFFMIRAIGQWQRMKVRKDFNEFVNFNIKRYESLLNLPDFDFSFENMKLVHSKIFGKEFDLEDKNLPRISSSLFYDTKINDIARRLTTIRNIFMLDQIEKYWLDGYNIFIIFGGSHAVMQEPVIKSLM
ncbi:MAG: hypothetical protein ABIF22_00605 [bacterium]